MSVEGSQFIEEAFSNKNISNRAICHIGVAVPIGH